MIFREGDSRGSFASSTGIVYDFDAAGGVLNISETLSQKPYARIRIPDSATISPAQFLPLMDRAAQIKALIYSNNASTHLHEILDENRIAPILEIASKTSLYAYDPSQKNYDRFAALFTQDFDLKTIKIKKFTSNGGDTSFYLARLQTQHDNSITVRGCTMPALIAALSERTLRDLVTTEFGHFFENSAQKLLNASSKLSLISLILDNEFLPARQIRGAKQQMSEKIVQ